MKGRTLAAVANSVSDRHVAEFDPGRPHDERCNDQV